MKQRKNSGKHLESDIDLSGNAKSKFNESPGLSSSSSRNKIYKLQPYHVQNTSRTIHQALTVSSYFIEIIVERLLIFPQKTDKRIRSVRSVNLVGVPWMSN